MVWLLITALSLKIIELHKREIGIIKETLQIVTYGFWPLLIQLVFVNGENKTKKIFE